MLPWYVESGTENLQRERKSVTSPQALLPNLTRCPLPSQGNAPSKDVTHPEAACHAVWGLLLGGGGCATTCMVLQHRPFNLHATPVTSSTSFLASLQPWHQASPLGHLSTLHWEQCQYGKLKGRACDQTCGQHRQPQAPQPLALPKAAARGKGFSSRSPNWMRKRDELPWGLMSRSFTAILLSLLK